MPNQDQFPQPVPAPDDAVLSDGSGPDGRKQ